MFRSSEVSNTVNTVKINLLIIKTDFNQNLRAEPGAEFSSPFQNKARKTEIF